jgi:hypothetical protein
MREGEGAVADEGERRGGGGMRAAQGGVERQGLGLGGEMCCFYIDGKRKF